MDASTSRTGGGGDASAEEEIVTPELYFLIAKFLSKTPCQEAAAALRREIEEHQLMPKRFDWQGHEHPRTFAEVEQRHRHVSANHLVKISARMGRVIDKELPSTVPGVVSLIGSGRQSLLRTAEDRPPRLTFPSIVPPSMSLSPTLNDFHRHPSFVKMITSREYRGRSSTRQTYTCKLYQKVQMHRRLLGHLSSVYCVAFDRTGHYVFTGADDLLVKIWSAKDGRLLKTLRGHSKEISDLAVNYENTLLAVGSYDKTIRVWCLRTTSPKCVLNGHQSEITSVKFCPLSKGNVRYLVSTGNDALVCFWEWDVDSNNFVSPSKPTHKFVERPRPGVHLLCSSFSSGGAFLAVGSTDHYVRVYHVNCPSGPQKILEIEGHNNLVDSIVFSNLGFRFLSGSKDGTAHIWRFEQKTWKSHLLKMTQRMPHDPPMDEIDLNRIKVNMVGWTCDDRYVVTSASDFSIKVWDANTGKLLHSLREHTEEVFVIEPHPTNPRMFLSGGHDGRLILWDVVAGQAINKIHNLIEGQGHGAIFDCKFSPDGQTIAATDSHGHIIIFGFGSNERFSRIPDHVFFHTDYRPLIRDQNNYVIDEQTQCPPHLMPPPFLVDIDGNPHPPALQRLVPGRENDSEERLVPHIAVQNERGVNEILDPIDPEHVQQDQAPQPLPPPPPPSIDDMIQRLVNENDRLRTEHDYAQPNPNPNANEASGSNNEPAAQPPPQPSEGSGSRPHCSRARDRGQRQQPAPPNQPPGVAAVRNEAHNNNAPPNLVRVNVEGIRQANANWQSRDSSGNVPVYARRIVVRPLQPAVISTQREQIEENMLMEQMEYVRETRRQAPPPLPLVRRDDQSKEKFTRRKKKLLEQRQGIVNDNAIEGNGPSRAANRNRNSNSNRNRRSNNNSNVRTLSNGRSRLSRSRNRGHMDYINPDDLNLSDTGSSHRQSGAETWEESSSSDSDSSSDSESEEEWNGDDDDNSQPATRRSRRAAASTHRDRKPDMSSKAWVKECNSLLEKLWHDSKAEPFQFPVDIIAYPDYNQIIHNPMDLNTLREQLKVGEYETPQEFNKDLQLIFANAREYTPNKKVPIHQTAKQFSEYTEEVMRTIINNYKSAKGREARTRTNDRKKRKGAKEDEDVDDEEQETTPPKKSKKKKQASKSKKKASRPKGKGKAKKAPSNSKKRKAQRILSSPDIDESAATTSGLKAEPGCSGASSNNSSYCGPTTRKRMRISSDEEAASGSGAAAPATNGRPRDFYRSLVESDSETDDDWMPTVKEETREEEDEELDHANSETEIDDDAATEEDVGDSDATEIVEAER